MVKPSSLFVRRLARLTASVVIAIVVAGPAAAQTADDPDILRQSLAEARDTYRQATTATTLPAGATQEEVLIRNHLLGEVVANLEQRLDLAQRLPDSQRRVEEQQAATREWTGFPTPPPYSVLLLDQLRRTQDNARFAAQAAAARAALLDREAAAHEQELRAAEIARRQAEEQLAAATADQRDHFAWERDLAAVSSRAAATGLELARRAKKLAEFQAAEKREAVALAERQIAVARRDARLTQDDLKAVLDDIDRQRAALEKRQAATQAASQRSRQALSQAQQALARFRAEPVALSEGETALRRDILERTVELRRLQADNDLLAIDLIKRMQDLRSWERTGWQFRVLLVNSSEADKLREGLDNLDQLLQQLRTWNTYLESELARPSGDTDTATRDRLAGLNRDQAALAQQTEAAQRVRLDLLREGQQATAGLQRTLAVWREDFLARGAERSARSIATDTVEMVRQGLRKVWQFEILSVEDNINIDGRVVVAARSVTLGKALDALLFLGVGYFASGWLARRAGQFAVRRLGVMTGHAKMISRWLHVLMLGTLLLVALYMVNIPLTMFAFLGGALAIGLGFGTQVLLKNLVAGIMLLIERPLKVGDLIEVGSIVGTVTNIDIRSSTVRTGDGIEILVPNATFIENNVTNWTYSNAKVRRSVKLGVDYSAAPSAVRDLLLQVAGQHGHVLTEPPPRVLFEDFGADALVFDLQYWIDYGHGTDATLVASDLRFMIEKALGEAGIAIPYPQRVVHLHRLPQKDPDTVSR